LSNYPLDGKKISLACGRVAISVLAIKRLLCNRVAFSRVAVGRVALAGLL
jgi:hypothetical protein